MKVYMVESMVLFNFPQERVTYLAIEFEIEVSKNLSQVMIFDEQSVHTCFRLQEYFPFVFRPH